MGVGYARVNVGGETGPPLELIRRGRLDGRFQNLAGKLYEAGRCHCLGRSRLLRRDAPLFHREKHFRIERDDEIRKAGLCHGFTRLLERDFDIFHGLVDAFGDETRGLHSGEVSRPAELVYFLARPIRAEQIGCRDIGDVACRDREDVKELVETIISDSWSFPALRP